MNTSQVSIHLLLPVTRDPHFVRRLQAMHETGARCHAHLFVRDGVMPSPDIPQTVHATLEHRRFFARLFPFLRSLPRLARAVRQADVVYAMGFDLLLIAWTALQFTSRKPRLFYEVADIHSLLIGTALHHRMMRMFEKRMLKRVHRIVVTSQAYATHYFQSIQGAKEEQILLQENKLYENEVMPRDGINDIPGSGDRLTIGYFGVLRCKRTWAILRRVAELSSDRVRIRVRGIPIHELATVIPRDASTFPNIEYGGPYNPREELGNIYNGLDLIAVFAEYIENHSIRNWPRTNRFYEGCYYRVPLLDNQGSANGEVIEHDGIGLTVNMDDVEEAATAILAVTRDQVEMWRASIRDLPVERYLHQDDIRKLVEQISA